MHPGAAGQGHQGLLESAVPRDTTLLCRTQGGDRDLLKPGAWQELDSHPARGSV